MASVELVRVVVTPVGADEKAAAELQFILDLKLDPATGKSAGPLPAFGRRGSFNKVESLYPFTLMADGRVDYGAHAPAAARQDNLDIRGRALIVGEPVTFRSAAGEAAYEIKSVTAHAG
jgi:hypothetical protein